jgi:hypothetical protein
MYTKTIVLVSTLLVLVAGLVILVLVMKDDPSGAYKLHEDATATVCGSYKRSISSSEKYFNFVLYQLPGDKNYAMYSSMESLDKFEEIKLAKTEPTWTETLTNTYLPVLEGTQLSLTYKPAVNQASVTLTSTVSADFCAFDLYSFKFRGKMGIEPEYTVIDKKIPFKFSKEGTSVEIDSVKCPLAGLTDVSAKVPFSCKAGNSLYVAELDGTKSKFVSTSGFYIVFKPMKATFCDSTNAFGAAGQADYAELAINADPKTMNAYSIITAAGNKVIAGKYFLDETGKLHNGTKGLPSAECAAVKAVQAFIPKVTLNTPITCFTSMTFTTPFKGKLVNGANNVDFTPVYTLDNANVVKVSVTYTDGTSKTATFGLDANGKFVGTKCS